MRIFQIEMPNHENNISNPVSMLFVLKRTTMLEYIYHGHSMAYDPILPVSNRD